LDQTESRSIHPALKALGYTKPITGTAKAGTHAFRRFRNTYLKNHAGCPSGLYKHWLGHASEDMSDVYVKVRLDTPIRREWAKNVVSVLNFSRLLRPMYRNCADRER
jgi:integrase